MVLRGQGISSFRGLCLHRCPVDTVPSPLPVSISGLCPTRARG
ncbi:hypothetical protein APASM_1293 [Actinosynnema pretiosum subsp. pretiosum]|nr:hypothetical protein APASM_1293 [Actinosynnema pretiosum subsp. pretiosum]